MPINYDSPLNSLKHSPVLFSVRSSETFYLGLPPEEEPVKAAPVGSGTLKDWSPPCVGRYHLGPCFTRPKINKSTSSCPESLALGGVLDAQKGKCVPSLEANCPRLLLECSARRAQAWSEGCFQQYGHPRGPPRHSGWHDRGKRPQEQVPPHTPPHGWPQTATS